VRDNNVERGSPERRKIKTNQKRQTKASSEPGPTRQKSLTVPIGAQQLGPAESPRRRRVALCATDKSLRSRCLIGDYVGICLLRRSRGIESRLSSAKYGRGRSDGVGASLLHLHSITTPKNLQQTPICQQPCRILVRVSEL